MVLSNGKQSFRREEEESLKENLSPQLLSTVDERWDHKRTSSNMQDYPFREIQLQEQNLAHLNERFKDQYEYELQRKK